MGTAAKPATMFRLLLLFCVLALAAAGPASDRGEGELDEYYDHVNDRNIWDYYGTGGEDGNENDDVEAGTFLRTTENTTMRTRMLRTAISGTTMEIMARTAMKMRMRMFTMMMFITDTFWGTRTGTAPRITTQM